MTAGPQNEKKRKTTQIYLLCGFEDITSEDVRRSVSGDVGENLEVLRVVGDVENAVYRMVHHLQFVLVQGGLLLLGERGGGLAV